MAVHDRHHVGPGAVDLAMDEALEIDAPGLAIARRAVQVELDDVAGLDGGGRHVARQQEMVRVLVVAHARMAEGVDHALVEQDVVGVDQILQQVGVHVR